MRKLRRLGFREDDPLDGVANFFDLGVIFALGFMVPLMAKLASPEAQGKTTESARAGADAQVAQNEKIPLDRYRASTDKLGGEGQRLGVAYRLKSGEVIYVPEGK